MHTPETIQYSDGSKIERPVIQIWEDLGTERRGDWYRAFWCASPESTTGSPVIGYCSAGGSQRTIRKAAREVWSLYADARIYRNGREIKK